MRKKTSLFVFSFFLWLFFLKINFGFGVTSGNYLYIKVNVTPGECCPGDIACETLHTGDVKYVWTGLISDCGECCDYAVSGDHYTVDEKTYECAILLTEERYMEDAATEDENSILWVSEGIKIEHEAFGKSLSDFIPSGSYHVCCCLENNSDCDNQCKVDYTEACAFGVCLPSCIFEIDCGKCYYEEHDSWEDSNAYKLFTYPFGDLDCPEVDILDPCDEDKCFKKTDGDCRCSPTEDYFYTCPIFTNKYVFKSDVICAKEKTATDAKWYLCDDDNLCVEANGKEYACQDSSGVGENGYWENCTAQGKICQNGECVLPPTPSPSPTPTASPSPGASPTPSPSPTPSGIPSPAIGTCYATKSGKTYHGYCFDKEGHTCDDISQISKCNTICKDIGQKRYDILWCYWEGSPWDNTQVCTCTPLKDNCCCLCTPAPSPGASPTPTCSPVPEICNNGKDDDCDDKEDCDDPDCLGALDEICDDGDDNDCDGKTDLEDHEDCDRDNDGYPPCGPRISDPATVCDCDDENPLAYPGAPEICFDGKDNNCDGKKDCDDPECADVPGCLPDCSEIIDGFKGICLLPINLNPGERCLCGEKIVTSADNGKYCCKFNSTLYTKQNVCKWECKENKGCKLADKVDLVFGIDTSGSMADEWGSICSHIDDIKSTLEKYEIKISQLKVYGIGPSCGTEDTTCTGWSGYTSPPTGWTAYRTYDKKCEGWGWAVKWISENFPWTDGSAKLIFAVADGGPHGGGAECGGASCDDPGNVILSAGDVNAVNEAISTATSTGAFVYGINSCDCDYPKGTFEYVSGATGGESFLYSDANDIPDFLLDVLWLDYADADDDGYIDENCPCDPSNLPPGIVGCDDCDDLDPDINPGVEESISAGNCKDGIDNDCDGFADICGDEECGCAGGLVPCGRRIDDPTTLVDETQKCTFCHFFIFGKRITDFVFLKLGISLVMLLITIGGFLFITSQGSPSRVSLARGFVKTALTGLGISGGVWFILNTFFAIVLPGTPYFKTWKSVVCCVQPCEKETPAKCNTVTPGAPYLVYENAQSCPSDCACNLLDPFNTDSLTNDCGSPSGSDGLKECDFDGECEPGEEIDGSGGSPESCPDCAECGDGIIDAGEKCDPKGSGPGDDVFPPNVSCETFLFAGGTLKCTNDCKLDFSDCVSATSP